METGARDDQLSNGSCNLAADSLAEEPLPTNSLPDAAADCRDSLGAVAAAGSREEIADVRSQLTPEENAAVADDMVLRYLCASAMDAKHAIRRLRSTLAWWHEENPQEMVCPACLADPSSHYMHVACRDLTERPVIYSCLALANNKSIEDNRKHMIEVFESAIRAMPPGVEQWCWLLDFHGFSIRDCDPRLARVFLHLAATHYPERLGQFWVVDAPVLFNTLWSALKPFIDPKTKEKITFVSLKKEAAVKEILSAHFDEQTAEWLRAEMQENRETSGKFYDREVLEQLVSSTKEPDEGHCNLGSPSFLRELHTKRELLKTESK